MTTSIMEVPSARPQRVAESNAEAADPRWKGLYRVGGAAALIIAVLIPIHILVFVTWPPPPFTGPALDWFTLFQANALLGLVSLDLLFLAVWVLQLPIFLALYVALRRASASAMPLATALAFVATAVYVTSNTAFEMLSLSGGYAAATTDAERATFLAAGQGMLATFQATAFKVGYVLVSIAGMLIAAAMLRSSVFSRATAYVRLAASVLGLGLFVPAIGLFVGLFAVVFDWIWYILIARGLFQLARQTGAVAGTSRTSGAP